MKELTKGLWCFFLASLTFGVWTFLIVAVLVVVNLILLRYKPEWYY